MTAYDATVLANDHLLADISTPRRNAKKPKSVANWIINDLLSALTAADKSINECPISARRSMNS